MSSNVGEWLIQQNGLRMMLRHFDGRVEMLFSRSWRSTCSTPLIVELANLGRFALVVAGALGAETPRSERRRQQCAHDMHGRTHDRAVLRSKA